MSTGNIRSSFFSFQELLELPVLSADDYTATSHDGTHTHKALCWHPSMMDALLQVGSHGPHIGADEHLCQE